MSDGFYPDCEIRWGLGCSCSTWWVGLGKHVANNVGTYTLKMFGTSYKDVYGWPSCVRPVGSWVVERRALRPACMIFSLNDTSAAIH